VAGDLPRRARLGQATTDHACYGSPVPGYAAAVSASRRRRAYRCCSSRSCATGARLRADAAGASPGRADSSQLGRQPGLAGLPGRCWLGASPRGYTCSA
jgi:hypothetical protein